MKMFLPLKVEMRGKASSNVSMASVLARIELLNGQPESPEQAAEVSYLREVLARFEGTCGIA